MWEPKISECHRKNLCVDCDNEKCWHCGHIEADCPKYHCDNVRKNDCDHCDFIKEFIRNMRAEYGMGKGNARDIP